MSRIKIKDLPKAFKFSWEEMRKIAGGAETIHLYRRTPIYRLYSDEVGQASLQFGEGIAGARPPIGSPGILASYRK